MINRDRIIHVASKDKKICTYIVLSTTQDLRDDVGHQPVTFTIDDDLLRKKKHMTLYYYIKHWTNGKFSILKKKF